MRLFAYYAIHTFINTLKKLFKTWIAIVFVAIILFGVVVGLIAATFADRIEEEMPSADEAIYQLAESGLTEEMSSEPTFYEKAGVTKQEFTELVISGIIIFILLLNIANTKSASSIFKPGDVSILFSSPLKPQTVMMFRLFSSLGLQIVFSIYMLLQLPNLIVNLELSAWGAVAVFLSWVILMIVGTIIQLTLYVISTRGEWMSKNMSKLVIGFFVILAAGLVLYTNQNGGDYFKCAVELFTGEKTYWIPFWGWLRGFCMSAIIGDNVNSVIFLALTLAGSGALIFMIWRMDADFYEDAMGAAERIAEMAENAKNSKTGVGTIRKKDRSEKLIRDGFKHGFGANVFFHKTLYNRYRFAFLHIFTVTTGIYTVVAGFTAYMCRTVTAVEPAAIVGCVLMLCVFYRTLGNPLQADTSKEYFVMVPENMYSKLMWSLLGGSLCCLLDLIPPMLLAGVLLQANPLTVLGWAVVIVSVDFFGTTVGAFIGVSVPVNAGATIKQVVQILFMYFGILPSGGLIAAAMLTNNYLLFMLLAALVNFGTGAIFFAITPRFLINGNK